MTQKQSFFGLMFQGDEPIVLGWQHRHGGRNRKLRDCIFNPTWSKESKVDVGLAINSQSLPTLTVLQQGHTIGRFHNLPRQHYQQSVQIHEPAGNISHSSHRIPLPGLHRLMAMMRNTFSLTSKVPIIFIILSIVQSPKSFLRLEAISQPWPPVK